MIGEPPFKKFNKELIDLYVDAVYKVVENHKELLKEQIEDSTGNIALTHRKK